MLELVAITLFALAVSVVLAAIVAPRGPPAATAWTRAARSLGLRAHSEARITGKIDGIGVSVESVELRSDDPLTCFRVTPRHYALPPITFGPRRRGEQGGHPLGEPGFDRVVVLGGPAAPATALDLDARRAVCHVVQRHGCGLLEGELRADVYGRVKRTREIVDTVRAMVATAKALDFGDETPQLRLARMVATDPLIRVRRRAFQVLTEEHADLPVTRDAAMGLTDHADAALRLQAALFLGDEGYPVLVGLAGDVTGSAVHRIGALDGIFSGGRTPTPTERELVLSMLDGDNAQVARGAARRAGIWRLQEAGSRLADLAGSSPDSATRAVAIRALARLADPGHLSVLVECLDDPVVEVVQVAARALYHVGGVAQVEVLQRLATRGPREAREAALRAVRAIQARVTGGDVGGLSVVDPLAEGGRLSVIDGVADPLGGVSLVNPEGS